MDPNQFALAVVGVVCGTLGILAMTIAVLLYRLIEVRTVVSPPSRRPEAEPEARSDRDRDYENHPAASRPTVPFVPFDDAYAVSAAGLEPGQTGRAEVGFVRPGKPVAVTEVRTTADSTRVYVVEVDEADADALRKAGLNPTTSDATRFIDRPPVEVSPEEVAAATAAYIAAHSQLEKPDDPDRTSRLEPAAGPGEQPQAGGATGDAVEERAGPGIGPAYHRISGAVVRDISPAG